ncbi:MAG: sensor histidine kinase [Chloroflexi bacterium]|nr:sensor histidine kinase [Chloroflexota bacterium]
MNTVLIFSTDPDSTLYAVTEDAGFTPVIDNNAHVLVDHAQGQTLVAILVDLTTDEDRGIEALQTFQNFPATAFVPRIAVVSADNKLPALENGAHELIRTPVDPIILRTRLRTMITLRQTMSAAQSDYQITELSLMGVLDVLEHDLRSPLGISFSSLELLSEFLEDEPNIAPPIFQLINNTNIALRRQLFLIADLLDWIRLTAEQYHYVPSNIAIEETINLGIQHGLALAESNGIAVEMDIQKGLGSPVGDAELLRRVINAGLDCALKFCLKGNTIRIRAFEEDGQAVITMTDPGRGIHEQFQNASIFDLGIQSEARNLGSRSSVAMGLPFARMAVERIGGTIDYLNEDELTTLRIALPL